MKYVPAATVLNQYPTPLFILLTSLSVLSLFTFIASQYLSLLFSFTSLTHSPPQNTVLIFPFLLPLRTCLPRFLSLSLTFSPDFHPFLLHLNLFSSPPSSSHPPILLCSSSSMLTVSPGRAVYQLNTVITSTQREEEGCIGVSTVRSTCLTHTTHKQIKTQKQTHL